MARRAEVLRVEITKTGDVLRPERDVLDARHGTGGLPLEGRKKRTRISQVPAARRPG
jgi:hypothetical protein